MDRYFYSIEELDGNKIVHLSGNIYFCDVDTSERDHRIAEWTWLFLELPLIKELFDNDCFYDFINEQIAYIGNITKYEAEDWCKRYFNGESGGTYLHMKDITENTPCGDYWFE